MNEISVDNEMWTLCLMDRLCSRGSERLDRIELHLWLLRKGMHVISSLVMIDSSKVTMVQEGQGEMGDVIIRIDSERRWSPPKSQCIRSS